MAVNIVGTPSVIVDGGSYTAESGTDRLLVFTGLSHTPNNHSITGVDFGAQAASLIIDNATARKGSAAIYMVKEADIIAGSQIVSMAISTGTLQGSQITCYTLTGVNQTTPVVASGQDNGIDNTGGVLSLASVADGLAISAASWTFGNATFNSSPADTDGFSAAAEAEVFNGPKGSFQKVTTGAAVSASYTDSNASHSIVLATFAPAAAGSGIVVLRRRIEMNK